MIVVQHDIAPFTTGTDMHEDDVFRDEISQNFLNYLSGRSTQIPRFGYLDDSDNIHTFIFVPESQYPKP
jgi:hypothetical protein